MPVEEAGGLVTLELVVGLEWPLAAPEQLASRRHSATTATSEVRVLSIRWPVWSCRSTFGPSQPDRA